MNSVISITDDNKVIAIPRQLLTDEERERIVARGMVRIGATHPGVWLCGQCKGREVKEDQGICSHCDIMLAKRRLFEEERAANFRYGLWIVCIIAVGIGVAILFSYGK